MLNHSIRPEVAQELFLLGYRNLMIHAVGTLLLASILTIKSWQIVARSIVHTWIVWSVVVVLAFAAAWAYFRQAAKANLPDAQALRQWRWIHPLLLGLIGIGWGGSVNLLVPQADVHNLLVITAFAGAGAYSAQSNGPNDPLGFFFSAAIAFLLFLSLLPKEFEYLQSYFWQMALLLFFMLGLTTLNARKLLLNSIELRLINEALARSNALNAERAEQANRNKSHFLAAASHDLRQPVHALLLLLAAYRQAVPAADKHPLMQPITAAGQSISDLFSALMELSRLESGTTELALSPLNLSLLIELAHERIRPIASDKGLKIRTRVAKKLASSTAMLDKTLFDRVLDNLLSNAVKYTRRGAVLISLRPAHGRSGLWIEVWDSGTGIAPADQDRIFEPYVQLNNRERDRAKGLGLGLTIVRESIKLMGLSLNLRSHIGRGSRFRLVLPPSICSLETYSSPHNRVGQTVLSHFNLAGRKVLLVENDSIVRQAMEALLCAWDIDLRSASSGDASVLEVCTNDWVPEVVISDFRLPGGMDGIGVLNLVLERFPGAIGILQTGELAARVQERAAEEGYLVLYKPVDPKTLGSTLANLLQVRREAT